MNRFTIFNLEMCYICLHDVRAGNSGYQIIVLTALILAWCNTSYTYYDLPMPLTTFMFFFRDFSFPLSFKLKMKPI